MAAATTAAVVAAAAATVVAASTVSSEACPCLAGLVGRGRQERKQGGQAGSRLPLIGAEAPVVKLRLDGPQSFGGPCHIIIVKDMLLIGRKPGEAEDTVHLSGAKVIVKGSTLLVTPRLTPPLTLYFGSQAEAERWAEKLRAASGMAAQQSAKGLADDPQRAQNARIAELEARVSATLHAAVDRSKRIRELEQTIEEGKDRDLRIKELEDAVEETMQEASQRGERIKELENVLASRGGVPDAAASMVLDDAMRFAEQMLENRQEELALDGESAQGLQEALEAAKEAKPAVDSEMAELVSQLVKALRWPMVLRRRLVDAEEAVKHQKELQDNTMRELHELQKKHAVSESEKAQIEAEVVSLRRQLKDQETQRSIGDSRELRDRLQAAEQAAQASVAQQRASLDAAHRAEVDVLEQRRADTEAARKEAQRQAADLREQLVVAERNADEAVAKQRELLEQGHAKEMRKLQQVRAEADMQRDGAERKALELRQQLAAAEQVISGAATRDDLAVKHQEEVSRLLREQEQAKKERDQAARQAADLQQILQASAPAQELQDLQEKHEQANKEREAAERRADQLYNELIAARKEDQDVAVAREQHARAEAAIAAMCEQENRAKELQEKLTNAEAALEDQSSRKRQFIDAERSRAFAFDPPPADVPVTEVIKREQAKLRELESTLQAAVGRPSPSAFPVGAAPRPEVAQPHSARPMVETMDDLDRRILTAQRSVDAAATLGQSGRSAGSSANVQPAQSAPGVPGAPRPGHAPRQGVTRTTTPGVQPVLRTANAAPPRGAR